MIATISLYEDKEEGKAYHEMNHNFPTYWKASVSPKLEEWIKGHAYRIAPAGIWVVDGEELVDFEDFYRKEYCGYPFTYSAAYRSHALTFEFSDNYGIKFFEEE